MSFDLVLVDPRKHDALIDAARFARSTLLSISNHHDALLMLLESILDSEDCVVPEQDAASILHAIDQLRTGEDGEGIGLPVLALERLGAVLDDLEDLPF